MKFQTKLLLPFLAAASANGANLRHSQDTTTTARTLQEEENSVINIPDDIVPALEEWISYGMNRTNTPGVAIAIVHNDTVAHLGGYGVRDVENQLPATPTTVFQLASVSKPITGSLIATVVGDGLVDWDTPISQLDPAFKLSDPYVSDHVTIRDMLSHRSGLPDHAGDLQEDVGYTREEILYNLRHLPLMNGFREKWVYTNHGFSEAGWAVAKLLETEWHDLIQERLFEPLGMNQTSALYDDFINNPERTTTYELVDEGDVLQALDPPRQPDPQSPAGGVSSSAADMAQWLLLQLGQRPDVIDADTLQSSHEPVVLLQTNKATGMPSFYGLGWNFGIREGPQVALSHSGAFIMGTRAEVSIRPASGLGLAVMANASPTGLPEWISYAFWELVNGRQPDPTLFDVIQKAVVADIVFPKNSYTPTVTEAETASLNMSMYVNTYNNDYWGDVNVTFSEEADDTVSKQANNNNNLLSLHLGTMIFPLVHLQDHVFAFTTVGENNIGESQVIFAVDADNTVRSVEIDYLNTLQAQEGTLLPKY